MFIDQFLALCNEKGVSPAHAAISIRVSKTSVTRWKNGSTPNGDILERLANYFGVTTDYLLTGDEHKKYPATGNGSGISEHDKLAMELIKKYDGLSDDDKRAVERMIDALLESQENSQKK